MRIAAFVRTTYGEWEGRDCCRLDVRGCNLRCPFCKAPAVLGTEGEDVDPATVLAYVRERGDTLDGVIVSGGEPLAAPDLYRFLRELKPLKRPVMLMTNGCYPDALDDLVGAELVDWVSLHLPAPLEAAAYARATGTPAADPAAVRRSLQIIQDSGVSWDCRTVAVPGLVDGAAIVQIAKAVGEKGILQLLQFDPRTCLDPAYQKLRPYGRPEAAALSAAAKPYVKHVKLRGF